VIHDALGMPYSKEWTCTRFVSVALNLPYLQSGSFGAVLARREKIWRKAKEGDIVVWLDRFHPEQFMPYHAGLYVDRGSILHNGGSGRDCPDAPMMVRYSSFYEWGCAWMRVY